MSTPCSKLTATNFIHTQRLLATVVAILQASNCLEFTMKAWLFLTNNLLELSTTQNTGTTTTEDKILNKLSGIEKKISAPSLATKAINLRLLYLSCACPQYLRKACAKQSTEGSIGKGC
jgi:hypothetical protein